MFGGRKGGLRLFAMAGIILLVALAQAPVAFTQDQPAYIRLVRKIQTAPFGAPNPTGLTYVPQRAAFHVLSAATPGQPVSNQAALVGLSLVEEPTGTLNPAIDGADPLHIVFDPRANRLLALDAVSSRLIEARFRPDGSLDSAPVTRYDTRQLGLRNPKGMAYDPQRGRLFILDAGATRLVRIDQDSTGGFDSQSAVRAGRVGEISLRHIGPVDPHGLALNPTNGHLYVLGRAKGLLYELSEDGQVVATRDLALLAEMLKLWDPQAMVFAPSGDQTDDPARLSLYIADRGRNASTAQGGKIAELTLDAPTLLSHSEGVNKHVVLVHVTDMSAWASPSPDPSGIAYRQDIQRLLVSDGEIEEAPQIYWQGYNLFEADSSGNLTGTATTFTANPTSLTPNNFAPEPTGVAWNPANGHLFFSDDDKRRIFEVNLGADGLYGTADDIVTSFDTRAYGNTDPEGLAFDTGRGHLLIADGVNAEVYDINPGPDGLFNGVAPTGDDLVSSFDTSGIVNLQDPEGIEYNAGTNTIYLTGPAIQVERGVVEMTLDGTVVSIFKVPNPKNPAGLAYGTASVGSGDHLFLTDRGLDNDTDPASNDGLMFELRLNEQDLIFADGFETGSLVNWSSKVVDGGDLSVSPTAALVGSSGMQALLDDITSIYVTDEWPDAEVSYRARFYFDPNSITMANNNSHYIFYGYHVTSGSSPGVLRIEFRFSSGSYQLRAATLNDSGSWINTAWFSITDAPHSVELYWRAAANNGGLTLWIDGVQTADVIGIDNDTRTVGRIKLGAVSGVDSGTQGTYYFDAFEGRRLTYIGP